MPKDDRAFHSRLESFNIAILTAIGNDWVAWPIPVAVVAKAERRWLEKPSTNEIAARWSFVKVKAKIGSETSMAVRDLRNESFEEIACPSVLAVRQRRTISAGPIRK